MYSIKVSTNVASGSPLESLVSNVSDIPSKLKQRKVISPAEFEDIMKLREKTHHQAPYVPQGSSVELFPGTFYLTSVDEKHRRAYSRVPKDSNSATQTATNGV